MTKMTLIVVNKYERMMNRIKCFVARLIISMLCIPHLRMSSCSFRC